MPDALDTQALHDEAALEAVRRHQAVWQRSPATASNVAAPVRHSRWIGTWRSLTPPAQMCFAVSLCAFFAAGLGYCANQLLAGWMEVAGMVAVGLFYLGMGILEFGRTRMSSAKARR